MIMVGLKISDINFLTIFKVASPNEAHNIWVANGLQDIDLLNNGLPLKVRDAYLDGHATIQWLPHPEAHDPT